MWQPLFSIIIPVYNGADYVKHAIESALTQTYLNLEIIVVNDGSKDNGETELVCKAFGDKIQYIVKENGGVSSALNCGIENMQGEYFSWLSHDDLYAPDKITESIAALSEVQEREKTIVVCGTQYIDSDSKTLSIINHSVPRKATGLEMFKRCFLDKKSLNGSALLIPRRAFDCCGKFSDLCFAQDMELWGRMMIANYGFITVPYKGSLIRIHPQQATNRLRNVYFEERPRFLTMLYDFTKMNTDNSKEFQIILLKTCHSTYPKPQNLIKDLEKCVNLGFIEKTYYTLWGMAVQIVKNIYHLYKSNS